MKSFLSMTCALLKAGSWSFCVNSQLLPAHSSEGGGILSSLVFINNVADFMVRRTSGIDFGGTFKCATSYGK